MLKLLHVVGGPVELKVDHPHMIGMLSPQTPGGDGGISEPPALAALRRTRNSSSRHIRCTRLRWIYQPSLSS